MKAEPHKPAPEETAWELVARRQRDAAAATDDWRASQCILHCLELMTCKCCASCATRRCKFTHSGVGCTQACRCNNPCKNSLPVQVQEALKKMCIPSRYLQVKTCHVLCQENLTPITLNDNESITFMNNYMTITLIASVRMVAIVLIIEMNGFRQICLTHR